MEVTKQKMRCAAAEDPSYPCKHHGEEQVSQLPGEEVTAACWVVSSPRCHRGKSQMEPDVGSHGQVRGQKVGPPRAAATPGLGGPASELGSACGRASAHNYHVIMCRHSRG